MTTLRLFTDGSVDPKSNIGYGAFLAVPKDAPYKDSFKEDVFVKKFEQTSSTKLELQTLIWALKLIKKLAERIVVFTDSQNIIGLHGRRKRLESNNYLSKKKTPIKNTALYQEFFRLTDQLDCKFIKIKGHKASRKKDEIEKIFTLVDRASRKTLRDRLETDR